MKKLYLFGYETYNISEHEQLEAASWKYRISTTVQEIPVNATVLGIHEIEQLIKWNSKRTTKFHIPLFFSISINF